MTTVCCIEGGATALCAPCLDGRASVSANVLRKEQAMNDTFTAEVEAEELEERRRAIDDMHHIYEWRQTEKAVKAELAAVDASASDYSKMSPLRRWLIDHEGERLHDDERGLTAWLQPSGSTDVYDTPLAVRERMPDIFQRLLELDCLRIDADRVKAAIRESRLEAADIVPFRHSVARTPSLKVERIKE